MNEQYKKTVVTITIPAFGSELIKDYLHSLSNQAEIREIRVPKRKYSELQTRRFSFTFLTRDWTSSTTEGPGEYTKRSFTFPPARDWAVGEFIKTLTDTFNPSFLTYKIKTVPMFKDDWELYEYLLKTHDWKSTNSGQERKIDELWNKLCKIDTFRTTQLYYTYLLTYLLNL